MTTVIMYSLVMLVAVVSMISGQSTEESYRNQKTTIGGQNYTDLLRIGDVLDVFNVRHIGAQWSVFEKKLNANCSKDIQEYLQALQTAEMWALKSKQIYYSLCLGPIRRHLLITCYIFLFKLGQTRLCVN